MSRYYDKDHCFGTRPLGPPRPLGSTSSCKSKGQRCGCNSAFKAVSNTDQILPIAGEGTKVLYPVEEFDVNNEYTPATSTFIPKQNGIYHITGSIFFTPFTFQIPTRVELIITVNGIRVATDTEDFGPAFEERNVISVSSLLQLQAGNRVEIFANILDGSSGTIRGGGQFTHFEGFRVG